MTFEKELETLINKHSEENNSDTPDFILAKYLQNCLNNFNEITVQRDNWHGFKNVNLNDNKILVGG